MLENVVERITVNLASNFVRSFQIYTNKLIFIDLQISYLNILS